MYTFEYNLADNCNTPAQDVLNYAVECWQAAGLPASHQVYFLNEGSEFTFIAPWCTDGQVTPVERVEFSADFATVFIINNIADNIIMMVTDFVKYGSFSRRW